MMGKMLYLSFVADIYGNIHQQTLSNILYQFVILQRNHSWCEPYQTANSLQMAFFFSIPNYLMIPFHKDLSLGTHLLTNQTADLSLLLISDIDQSTYRFIIAGLTDPWHGIRFRSGRLRLLWLAGLHISLCYLCHIGVLKW